MSKFVLNSIQCIQALPGLYKGRLVWVPEHTGIKCRFAKSRSNIIENKDRMDNRLLQSEEASAHYGDMAYGLVLCCWKVFPRYQQMASSAFHFHLRLELEAPERVT